ncbi:hypothetical protein [Burkholderia sp. A1]|uniref:hypothetical protein n=1 Tax=Burkholderia sp. A1 TaxID=148446 RepID=UPI0004690C05|nr:hypothetical protein [Burkholderia sp. A1]
MNWLRRLLHELLIPIAIIALLDIAVHFILSWSGLYDRIDNVDLKSMMASAAGPLLYFIATGYFASRAR